MNSTDDSLDKIIPTQSSFPMFDMLEDTTSQPLILSSADSRASRIPFPAAEKALMIAGISGLSLPELSASYNQESCCWKTFPEYSAQLDWITGKPGLLTPSQSLMTCAKWVTWDAQALYQHPQPERLTNVSDGFVWPTPTADDTTNRQPSKTAVMTQNGTYRHVAADGEQSFMRLSQVAKMWTTPAAQDAKNATLPPSQGVRDTLPGDIIRASATGQLNADWVDMLMGLPAGYSNPNGLPVPAKRSIVTSHHVPRKKSKRTGRRG